MKPGRRVDLCYEGLGTTDGRYIEPGALRLRDEPVPVTAYDGRGMNEVIGRASDFERREVEPGRNVVSAVIELDERVMVEADQVNRHIEVTELEGGPETRGSSEEVFVVRGGVLRAVFLSQGPGGWPSLNVGEAVVDHMQDPLVVDLSDDLVEWLIDLVGLDAPQDAERADVLAALKDAHAKRRGEGGG